MSMSLPAWADLLACKLIMEWLGLCRICLEAASCGFEENCIILHTLYAQIVIATGAFGFFAGDQLISTCVI